MTPVRTLADMAPSREPIVLPAVGTECPDCKQLVPSKSKQGRHFKCIVRMRRREQRASRGKSLTGPALAEHRDAVKDAIAKNDLLT